MRSTKILFACCILLISQSVKAQSRIEIKAGSEKTRTASWDIGVSPGVFVNRRAYVSNSFTIGGDLRFQKKFGDKFTGLVSLGFLSIDAYPVNTIYYIKAGTKLFVSPIFYVAGEIGFGEYSEGGELLIYTPSIGIMAGKRFDFALKYESYSNLSWPYAQLGLRVGYRFSK